MQTHFARFDYLAGQFARLRPICSTSILCYCGQPLKLVWHGLRVSGPATLYRIADLAITIPEKTLLRRKKIYAKPKIKNGASITWSFRCDRVDEFAA